MKRLIVLACVLLLTGCASSPKTQFYVLNAVSPQHPAAAVTGAPIVVEDVRIPNYLDRPGIVRRLGPNRIDISGVDHWGAPLGSMIRRTLTEDLQKRLPKGMVVLEGNGNGSRSARGLIVRVQDFTADPSGAVTLGADWSVLEGTTPTPTSCGQETITIKGSDTTRSAQINAMSRALARLSDHIADALSEKAAGGTATSKRCPAV